MTKFEITNRGTNTKEHWEESHIKFISDWNGVKPEELEEYIKKYWYHYDWVMNLIDLYKVKLTNNNILDVGCAPNRCLAFYAQKYPDLNFCGIDFTDRIKEFAALHADIPNLSFLQMDFLEEEIPGTYGAIMILEVLEHIENGNNFKLVDELLSKCRYLFISVPVDDSSNDGEHISAYTIRSFDAYPVVVAIERPERIFMFMIKGKL